MIWDFRYDFCGLWTSPWYSFETWADFLYITTKLDKCELYDESIISQPMPNYCFFSLALLCSFEESRGFTFNAITKRNSVNLSVRFL